ncbi:MAG: histidine kinase dimerization/phospho-acceptor domain-containing protein, partial [Mariprofundaceae bacterium]|nr:histidine kinase dimerization/phospho-acceptor domain-containing protein [Mariprofundaceae bacterium]
MGARGGLTIPVIMVTLISFLLWGKVPDQGLLLWAGLAYIITVVRFFSIPLNVHKVEAKQVQRYLLCFAWSTNAYGLIWSMGVVYFMPYVPFEYQMFLILLLSGIAMAMVFLVATSASILIFPCLLLPVILWLLLQPSMMYMQLGIIVSLLLIFFMFVGRQQFARFSDGILTYHKNNKLIKELKSEILEHEHTSLALQSSKVEAEQANDAKGEFLSLMSHELRTPIHGIIGTLDLLSDAKLNEEHQEN